MNFNELLAKIAELDSNSSKPLTEGVWDDIRDYIEHSAPSGLKTKDEILDDVFAAMDGQGLNIERLLNNPDAQDEIFDLYMDIHREREDPMQNITQAELDHDRHGDPSESVSEDDAEEYSNEQPEDLDESIVDECGGMGPPPLPPQQDSVTMNVSMNGSGKGGIRDLIDVLRSLEDTVGGDDDSGEIDIDIDHDDEGGSELFPKKLSGKDNLIDDELEGDVEEWANSPDEVYGSVGDVTRSGNDIHRSKDMFKRSQPGDNPMAVETLRNRLDKLYQTIKESADVDEAFGRGYNPDRDAQRDWEADERERRRDKSREQNWGVEHETNNVAIEINGKVWKVIRGEAENPIRALARGRAMAATIERNAQAKGRKVKVDVYVTGASATESVEVQEGPEQYTSKPDLNKILSRYPEDIEAFKQGDDDLNPELVTDLHDYYYNNRGIRHGDIADLLRNDLEESSPKVTVLPPGPAPKGAWGKGLSKPRFDRDDAPRSSRRGDDDYTDRRMRDAENRGTMDNERIRRSMRGQD